MKPIIKEMQLHDTLSTIHQKYRGNLQPIPSRSSAQRWIRHLLTHLFPVHSEVFGPLDIMNLELQLRQLLLPIENVLTDVDKLVDRFFRRIPDIFIELQEDAQNILAFDPAAHSIEEILGAYPGFYAVAVYRFSHELYQLKIPVLPRLLSEYAHSVTGIDINPGAIIGSTFLSIMARVW